MNSHLQHEELFRGNIRNRYSCKMLICGCGALGSWLVDLLSRQGYEKLSVLDRDKVEDTNFGTQNFGKADTGRLKAQQLAANVYRRIGVVVEPISKELNESNANSLLRNYDLVVDLFDNGESRELIRNVCQRNQIECVHAGLAAMGYFEVRWNNTYIAPTMKLQEDAPCEYPMASNLVIMCVSTVAEVINRFVDNHQKMNSTFWLNSMSLEIEIEKEQ